VLLALVCSTVSHAQPQKLTLDEAVAMATQHNSSVKITGDKVRQMDARIKEARAGLFPSLTNESNLMHIAQQQSVDIPAGALGVYSGAGPIPATGVQLNQGKPNFGLSTTTFSQPLTQYFKTRAGVELSRAGAAEARSDLRRTENDVAYKVKEFYYAILATERRRDAFNAEIRAAQLRDSETRNAVVTGVALQVKAAETNAQIAQAMHASGQLDDSVRNMREELADLCGLPVDTELELALPLVSSLTLVSDTEERVNAAYEHNPEIEAAQHQVEKARAAVRAARAEYIPEVSAVASHVYQNGAPFLSHNNGVVGFHMTWTVFEFGKRRGQVMERSAEVAQAEDNLARLKNRVRIDVEKAIRKLNRAETGVESARRLVTATTEGRRVSSDQAEIGTANRSVFLESEASMLNAEADLLRAEYDRSVAAAELARLTGSR
jgi:outer membrane protein TolC